MIVIVYNKTTNPSSNKSYVNNMLKNLDDISALFLNLANMHSNKI